MSEPNRPKKKDLLGPADIIKDLHDLPSAPEVLPGLLTILNDSMASMEDVMTLIKLEPGIASRVLQMGNSAYYSKGGRCTSLDQAVNRIGSLKIYEIVAFAAASQLLMRKLGHYGMEAEELWHRSVVCAISASFLASFCEFDPNLAYTIGLFHSVGMVAMDAWLKGEGKKQNLVSEGLPNETTEAEKLLIGFTNATVAGALLKSWSFQSSISEAVRWQYSPLSAGANRRAACLLHVAKWLQVAALNKIPRDFPAMPAPAILKVVGLGEYDYEALYTEVREEFERVSQIVAAI
jgi:HD-like signal output (HDOD) protein